MKHAHKYASMTYARYLGKAVKIIIIKSIAILYKTHHYIVYQKSDNLQISL